MSGKLGKEPAFPVEHSHFFDMSDPQPGMNKRFYAACAAMQGLLSNSGINVFFESKKTDEEKAPLICNIAFTFADELLKQENK